MDAAELAYLRELEKPGGSDCAKEGLARLGRRTESCAYATALNEAGDRKGAHAAYLKVLAADPSSRCALVGAKQTAASTSIWSRLGNAAENAGKALGAIFLGLLLLTILVLIWLQVQTRTPWLRDLSPARGIRRPTLQIAAFDDQALSEHLGPPTAGLIRGRISWRKDRFGVNLVSGQAGVATALRDLGDISGETKAAVAVISFLTASLPRRRFVLSGELQPAGAEGPGISLELSRQEGFEALITFWAGPLGLELTATADVYQHLAIAAAAWVDHWMATAVGGNDLLTRDPQSWAFFRCGVDAQRLGDQKRARLLYEQARVMDGTNIGALANLGILCRRINKFEDAERYLRQALEATEDATVTPQLPMQLNPDWYRIKYQLAALYSNWAVATDPGPQKSGRAQEAATLAVDLAQQALQTIQQPPSTGIVPSVPGGFLKTTLMPFVKGTIEPSALVLVACTVDPLPEAPAEGSVDRPTRDEILSALGNSPINPWPLIAYVESGDSHPPNAFFDLACFYTRAQDFNRAANRLVTAVRDTPISERKALMDVARDDPTLKSLQLKRPGLIPKLKELFEPDTEMEDEAKGLVEEFDLQDHVYDWLVGNEWKVFWAESTSQFTLIAEKESESLLIELMPTEDILSATKILTTVGSLTAFCEDHPERENVRALVIMPPESTEAEDINFSKARERGVDVHQATGRGSFTRRQ